MDSSKNSRQAKQSNSQNKWTRSKIHRSKTLLEKSQSQVRWKAKGHTCNTVRSNLRKLLTPSLNVQKTLKTIWKTTWRQITASNQVFTWKISKVSGVDQLQAKAPIIARWYENKRIQIKVSSRRKSLNHCRLSDKM